MAAAGALAAASTDAGAPPNRSPDGDSIGCRGDANGERVGPANRGDAGGGLSGHPTKSVLIRRA